MQNAPAPGQGGPQRQRGRPASKRRFPWAKVIIFGLLGLILLAVAALFFTKYKLEASVREPGEPVKMTYAFNLWMSDGYGAGVGQAWQAPGMVIGTSKDRKRVLTSEVVEPKDGQSWGGTVGLTMTRIHDTATGEVLQEFDRQYDCHQSLPAIEGKVYCAKTPGPGVDPEGKKSTVMELGALDIATGEFTSFYNAPFVVTGLQVIGVKDGRIYAGTRAEIGEVFIAFNGDGSIAWQVEGLNFQDARHCRIAGDALGCELSGRLLALSLADGSTVFDESVEGGIRTAWSDEGVAVGEFFGKESDILRFDGGRETTEVHPNTVSPSFSLLPRPVLTHDDMSRGDIIGAVGIDGKAYAKNQPGSLFTESGTVLLETDTFIEGPTGAITRVSEHGKAFIVDQRSGHEEANLVNANGDALGQIPEGMELKDGIFVSSMATAAKPPMVIPPTQ